MKILRRLVAAVVMLAVMSSMIAPSVAQNLNTSNLSSSPYNRYGYGRLCSMGNSVTRTMGDVGIAVRSNMFTNLANPASLTAIDTLTMLFTMGLDAQYGHYSEAGASNSKWDAGFSGMSFQAPLWKDFAMSLSLSPYSMVGYRYGTTGKLPVQSPVVSHDTLTTASSYAGVGGINNFMFGLGWRPFRNKKQEFNVGVNAGWLFGTIQHTGVLATSAQANSTNINYEATVRGLLLQLGAQYTYKLGPTSNITVGAIWAPQLNMNVGTEVMKYSTDTIAFSDKYRSSIKQPARFGGGISYNILRKLILTAEYEQVQWGQVNGLNTEMVQQDGIFRDTHRFAVGGEYLPQAVTNRFFKACRYRAGFSYQDSYIRVGNCDLTEYGATLGISMPINRRSALDLGVGYKHVQPSQSSLLSEDYFTIHVGVTFNEMMFFRNMLR